MPARTLSLTLALTPTLPLTKEFTALCHYAYLNGIQRSTYELIAVIVSMVTFAVHSLRGLPLELSVRRRRPLSILSDRSMLSDRPLGYAHGLCRGGWRPPT